MGKHCETGAFLVEDWPLDRLRVGDVLVTPATGAYTYSRRAATTPPRAPKSPRGGRARLVVRRETYEDLVAATSTR